MKIPILQTAPSDKGATAVARAPEYEIPLDISERLTIVVHPRTLIVTTPEAVLEITRKHITRLRPSSNCLALLGMACGVVSSLVVPRLGKTNFLPPEVWMWCAIALSLSLLALVARDLWLRTKAPSQDEVVSAIARDLLEKRAVAWD